MSRVGGKKTRAACSSPRHAATSVRVHRLGVVRTVPLEAMADEHWPVGGKGAHAAEDPGQSGTTWRGNRVTGPSP